MGEPHEIPWKTLRTELGDVPFFVIEFDERGDCTSPMALERLLKETRRTDIFLFSHGWNNDWRAATDRYERFVSRFIEVRQASWNPPDRAFRPVCVGVFWPSAALVAPWEQAPVIAAAAAVAGLPGRTDEVQRDDRSDSEAITQHAGLQPGQRTRSRKHCDPWRPNSRDPAAESRPATDEPATLISHSSVSG